jgi:hypothetical protein
LVIRLYYPQVEMDQNQLRVLLEDGVYGLTHVIWTRISGASICSVSRHVFEPRL